MANTFKVISFAAEPASAGTAYKMYTVAGSTTTVVLGIMISNTSTSAARGSVQLVSTTATSTNSGASNANESTHLIKDAPISNSSSLEVMSGNKIILQTGDVLKAKSDTASALDIAISYMEIT